MENIMRVAIAKKEKKNKTQKKTRMGHRTDRARFSRLLRHEAGKWIGSIR